MEGTQLTPLAQIFYSGSGLAAARPAAAGLRNGSLWFSTDTLDIDQVVAGAWVTIFDASTVGAAHAATHIPGGADPMRWTAAKLLLGAGPAADPTEVDMPSPLTVAETEVYNAAAPVAWTDLDLSGTIGAQATFVILRIKRNAAEAVDYTYSFRRNGDATEYYFADVNFNAGTGQVAADFPSAGVFIVVTDVNGVIEWRSENVAAHTITIIGYIK